MDCLARQYLWNSGYDYNHGTGHGVGHRLNVHEGPQRIATPSATLTRDYPEFSLKSGMVVSNEPGCYLVDKFGVRIENLVEIIQCEGKGNSGSSFLGFNDLTSVPYERRLIDIKLLSEEEMKQVDKYHSWCRSVVMSHISLISSKELGDCLKNWLIKATEPLFSSF